MVVCARDWGVLHSFSWVHHSSLGSLGPAKRVYLLFLVDPGSPRLFSTLPHSPRIFQALSHSSRLFQALPGSSLSWGARYFNANQPWLPLSRLLGGLSGLLL